MIAKIMTNDCVYSSPVFAVSLKHHNTKAVVFDSSFSELIVVDIFKRDRYKILFTDFQADDFAINEQSFKSYWNDRKIFKRIKHKKYTTQMYEEAKKILAHTKQHDFTDIKTPSDLDALDFNTGSFHDAYILGMTEDNGELQILFDTTWGCFLSLRCKGVLQNELAVGATFCGCSMMLDDDGNVVLSFGQISSDEDRILKAKNVRFKALFEDRIPFENFTYAFSNNELTIHKGNNIIRVDKVNTEILDFGKRNVLGYLEIDDIIIRIFIFAEDIVFSTLKYADNRMFPKLTDKAKSFQQEGEKRGYRFDTFPWDEEHFVSTVPDYGELIYREKYGVAHALCFSLRFLIPIIFANNLVWSIIQLLIPEMKWIIYCVFGVGVSLIVFLLCVLMVIYNGIKAKRQVDPPERHLGIYENGIKYNGYDVGFEAGYNSISKIEFKKRIIIHAHGMKFTLHRSKHDNIIYELINQRVNESSK